MSSAITVSDLFKTYASGFSALKGINLSINRGEIFALLGPNGAGKTTLISIICGLVNATSGSVQVNGKDNLKHYREVRRAIGLVPQEISTDSFETVLATVRFSRGLFGLPPDEAKIERILRALSLWEKRNDKIMALSGGMKRRVMIAKALAHDPDVLFLDEPTAGVDVELRRDMWQLVHKLREQGVTIILTTHYIEEAEEMADRIGVINRGEIILVEDKDTLMRKLGKKQLILHLKEPLESLPDSLQDCPLELDEKRQSLIYTFDSHGTDTGIADLLAKLAASGIEYRDLGTRESSLEDIFVNLVKAQ